MAEETKKSTRKKNTSALVGSGTEPVVLDSTTKLDIDTKKVLIDNIINTGLQGGIDVGAIEEFTTISNNRETYYELIDTMAQDSSVSSIIRTYTEDVTDMADNGHIVWAESSDPKVSKFVNYLLNVTNVDKNVFGWTYCLLKYGDVYLRLGRESDYEDRLFNKASIGANDVGRRLTEGLDESINVNVHTANDHYSYYVEMVTDPGSMFELTKFGKTYGYIEVPMADNGINHLNDFLAVSSGGDGSAANYGNYRMRSNDINIHQADDYVHACLEDGQSRFPEKVNIFTSQEDYDSNVNNLSYSVKRGKSLLADSYKIWREKQLLEASVLLNRLTRSSVVKTVQVEVGDMPKSQVQQTLRRIKELFEQKSAIKTGTSFSEYSNAGPVENIVYLATHNGQGAVTVGSVGGDVDVKGLADLDTWTNKFYSSYGIPKQYFGWTDDGAGFNAGSSLTIISSVYAKGVVRVKNAIIQMITDMINLFLLDKGCKVYLNNFTIKMKTPITQEEKDYRASLTDQINAISNFNSLFTDVEDKARRLEILKTLVKPLNYGDEIINQIDKEIDAAEKAKKKAEEEAAKQAELEAGGGEAAAEPTVEPEAPAEEAAPEEAPAEDFDLGMSSVATESVDKESEPTVLVEANFGDTSEELPTPEALNEKIDWTENK